MRSPKQVAVFLISEVEKLRDFTMSCHSNALVKSQFKAYKGNCEHEVTFEDYVETHAETTVYDIFVHAYHGWNYKKTLLDRETAIDTYSVFKTKILELENALKDIDLKQVFSEYGVKSGCEDVKTYFFEDFLATYNKETRVKSGSYYTPKPIVDYMIDAVDVQLKSELGFKDGIADITLNSKGEHEVKILDPATGTAVFLACIIKRIYDSNFKNTDKDWAKYVKINLLPRLYGFELLGASFLVAKANILYTLAETGYKMPDSEFRGLHIYNTNALNPPKPQAEMFVNTNDKISKAKRIKPLVIIGNPPYAISGKTESGWIEGLVDDYRKHNNVTSMQALSADGAKFIRYAEYAAEMRGASVVSLVVNSIFLYGPVAGSMRKRITKSFDSIHVLDLNGRKDYVRHKRFRDDQNVFNVTTGISINTFVKKAIGGISPLVFYAGIAGQRKKKLDYVRSGFKNTNWVPVKPEAPYHKFKPTLNKYSSEYSKFYNLEHIFKMRQYGATPRCARLHTAFTRSSMLKKVVYVLEKANTYEVIENKFHLPQNTTWDFIKAASIRLESAKVEVMLYKPFDFRFFYNDRDFTGDYCNHDLTRLGLQNPGIIAHRTHGGINLGSFVVRSPALSGQSYSKYSVYIFMLYTYENGVKTLNIKENAIKKFEQSTGLTFSENETGSSKLTPLSIFDYISAILNSNVYAKRYYGLWSVNFPDVPMPKNKEMFIVFSKLGCKLRKFYTLNNIEYSNIDFPAQGNNKISKKFEFKNNRIYINKSQYFEPVTKVAWEHIIGDFQPLRRWIKYRIDRKLSKKDITHFKKVIVALENISKIIPKIDKEFQALIKNDVFC